MTEHSVHLVLPGDVESVRARLVPALERLDYVVLNTQPITARRKARQYGALSTNVLNYSMELTVGLTPHGGQATKATFFYKWNHTWGAIGDKPTLTREAEAIAALASLHARVTACPSCGKEGVAETRFCRQCGAPLPAATPAELEMLRLTAAANAAGKAVSFSIVIGFVLIVVIGLGLILQTKSEGFQWLSLAISIAVWIAACTAGTRLMNAINAKLERKEELLSLSQQLSLGQQSLLNAATLDAKAIGSVVEGTTNLLPQNDNPTAVPIQRDRRATR